MAKITAEKEIQAKAQASVSGSLKAISTNDRCAMRQVVEGTLGLLSDDEVPGPNYITLKVDEVEQNDPRVPPLDEIAHLEHSTDVDLTVGVDDTGAFRTIKKLHVNTPTIHNLTASACRSKRTSGS